MALRASQPRRNGKSAVLPGLSGADLAPSVKPELSVPLAKGAAAAVVAEAAPTSSKSTMQGGATGLVDAKCSNNGTAAENGALAPDRASIKAYAGPNGAVAAAAVHKLRTPSTSAALAGMARSTRTGATSQTESARGEPAIASSVELLSTATTAGTAIQYVYECALRSG
jgi:hypothetical protein